jgi:hypothetical protein
VFVHARYGLCTLQNYIYSAPSFTWFPIQLLVNVINIFEYKYCINISLWLTTDISLVLTGLN